MLTAEWFPLNPHKEQSEAWRTAARFVGLACGRGSGKTMLARRRVVRYLPIRKPWSNPAYFYALPTRQQAKRVAWDPLKALIPASWIRPNGISESGLIIRTVFGSELHLVGMDRPERIEGVQWDGGILDESCDQKPGSFAKSVRPALTHRHAWCWRIGVPKRFGCGAADFKAFWEMAASKAAGPDYAAWTWPSHGIVPEEDLVDQQQKLDQRDYDEQYGGIWQGVSGLVHYSFDESLNVSELAKYDPSQPIVVGSDFNVDPMAWVVGHLRNEKFMFFDEVWKRNCNTRMALDDLYARYGQHKSGWVFIGDATSKARKTSASESDYEQIRKDIRFERKKVCYPSSNPPRSDRFAAVNARLCNAAGDHRLLVNPKCKRLIWDLSNRAYREGTSDPDDYGDVGHVTDALGYVIHYLRPIAYEESGTAKAYVSP